VPSGDCGRSSSIAGDGRRCVRCVRRLPEVLRWRVSEKAKLVRPTILRSSSGEMFCEKIGFELLVVGARWPRIFRCPLRDPYQLALQRADPTLPGGFMAETSENRRTDLCGENRQNRKLRLPATLHSSPAPRNPTAPKKASPLRLRPLAGTGAFRGRRLGLLGVLIEIRHPLFRVSDGVGPLPPQTRAPMRHPKDPGRQEE
jgi:hypothetical protein